MRAPAPLSMRVYEWLLAAIFDVRMVPELGSARTAIAEHRAIVRGLKAGQVEAARAAMSRHVGRSLVLAREIAERHPDYFEAAATSVSA